MPTIPHESKSRRRATLGDIARQAGVTVGTVSGVLTGKAKERRISDEVAARVRRVALEVDYAPNLLVHSLRYGKTKVLSFYNGFRTRDRRDFYMDALATAVERAAGAHGYNILVYCDFKMESEATYRTINGRNNDGLIFFRPDAQDPLLPFLRKSKHPVVLLNSADDEGVLSSVTEDWKSGIREVAGNLMARGHRRIAAFGGRSGMGDHHDRIEYLRDLLGASGVSIPERWVVPVDAKIEMEGIDALKMLMAEPTPPTALFCWHDYVGYAALEACEQLGLDVPRQLSVVGYDGLRWPARTTHTLASVHVDLDAMGESAVQLLIRMIEHEALCPVKQVLPVEFDPGTTLADAA